MTKAYVESSDLTRALNALKDWGSKVSTQPSRHVWSVLPLKHAGAKAGGAIDYTEELDKRFMDLYFRLRDGDRPYFDPFSMTWLQEGYYHSNLATSRKKTFNNSWKAGTFDQGRQSLAQDYAEIFREKALTRSGETTRLPAYSCAIWFYKRPSVEWGSGHIAATGLPASDDLLTLFREDFSFDNDSEWASIFDEHSPFDAELREEWL